MKVEMYTYVWTHVLCDYKYGVIMGTGTSLEDVRRKFKLNGSDFYLEALTTEPDFTMPSSSDNSIHYQYGSS